MSNSSQSSLNVSAETPVIVTIDDDEVASSTTQPKINESQLAHELFESPVNGHRSCKQCGDRIKFNPKTKTALILHQKARHRREWDSACSVVKSGAMPSTVPHQIKLNQDAWNVWNQNQFEANLLRWIVKDQQSFKVVENEDFRSDDQYD